MTADLQAIKTVQKQAWMAGDYQVVSNALNLQAMSEVLCSAAPVLPHHRVLDVATGTGNTALAAKRRGFPHVTGCDYSGELLEIARNRADADRLDIIFEDGDAEALPYSRDSFDVVLSTVGVNLAPNQKQAARELIRVCKPGGKVAWTSWTLDGDITLFNKNIFEFVPPPPEMASPLNWATPEGIDELFGDGLDVVFEEHELAVPVRSPESVVDMLISNFGPAMAAISKLDDKRRKQLRDELIAGFASRCRPVDGAFILPGSYAAIVGTVQ
jgi:SAM-dependent methyltransferase